jgi:hypothetical protein
MVTKGAKGLVPTTDWEKRPSSSVLGAVGEARRSDQPKKMQLERNNLDTLALGLPWLWSLESRRLLRGGSNSEDLGRTFNRR